MRGPHSDSVELYLYFLLFNAQRVKHFYVTRLHADTMYVLLMHSTLSSSNVIWFVYTLKTESSHEATVVVTGAPCCWFSMMTSSNGNIFRVTGPLCGEFTGHRWIPLTKANDAELWCFLWSAINDWVNNREAGDLRRYHAHYDVIVMKPSGVISDDKFDRITIIDFL